MSNRTIYEALVGAGMTREGACAVLGNMAAESGMKPDIAQRGMTGLSDEAYTKAADRGEIDFARDCVGYGLCQWTYPTRKAALLAHAKARGLSVGDETAQLSFCVSELTGSYPALWKELCSSHELYALTEAVCTTYERPAVNNVAARYDYAKQALACYAAGTPSVTSVRTGDSKLGMSRVSRASECSLGEGAMQPSEGDASDISGVLELLAGYLLTEEFAAGFRDYIRRSTS